MLNKSVDSRITLTDIYFYKKKSWINNVKSNSSLFCYISLYIDQGMGVNG